MSKDRKLFLSTLILLFTLVGLGAVFYVFSATLKPNPKSSDIGDYQFWIVDLKVSEKMEAAFLGKPILIERVSESDFHVWDLLPSFTDLNVYGCKIRAVDPYQLHPDHPYTYFAEPCRSVFYDVDGNINPGGDPRALPMKQLSWELKGNYLYVLPNT